MTTKHIDHDQTKTFDLTDKADHWVLDKGVTVDVDYTGLHIHDADNLTLTVAGTIHATSPSVNVEAVWSESENTHVHITDSGLLTGTNGVNLSRDGGRVVNDGKIILDDGNGVGIGGQSGDAVVRNNGVIKAEMGIDFWEGGKVVNSGTITSHTAVEMFGDTGSTIVNYGTLKGSYDSIWTGDGDDHITNHGKIIGRIESGAGNDTIDLRHGDFSGSLSGGAGNDTYFVTENHLDILELSGQGYDMVWTTADFTLQQAGYVEIEFLGAKGHDDLNLHGNFYDNILKGNSGRNDLIGDDGDDTFISGAGDDWMQGGSDHDTFVFHKGDGHDIIDDFTTGSEYDTLDVHFFKQFKTMDDLMAAATETSGGVMLHLGKGDSVMLEDMKLSYLENAEVRFAL